MDVCVLGSFAVDLMSVTPHLPLPGETVLGQSFHMGAGGKGSNQAIAAHKAGARVQFITKIGRDAFADFAKSTYAALGMDVTYVYQDAQAATGAALILVQAESGQNSIVVNPGACMQLTAQEIEQAADAIGQARIFLTQLETNLPPVLQALSLAKAKGVPTILNPAPFQPMDDAVLQQTDWLTPNETEAGLLCGFPIASVEDAQRAAGVLRAKGVAHVVITLGEKGLFYADAERSFHLPAQQSGAVIDTTGAGDCFNGALACALSQGASPEQACRFANAAASLCVTRMGAASSMPTREQIERQMQR